MCSPLSSWEDRLDIILTNKGEEKLKLKKEGGGGVGKGMLAMESGAEKMQ